MHMMEELTTADADYGRLLGSHTPEHDAAKIPERNEPPPPPRKKPWIVWRSKSNNHNHKSNANGATYFNPPDLDLIFKVAPQIHRTSHHDDPPTLRFN